jgi:Mrp family chromosome partitioning ATPase
MFENPRRAEQARREKNGVRDAPAPAKPKRRYATDAVRMPSPNGSGELPEDFARELGILRNAIDTSLKQKQQRSILFTSASHEEGVTTLASSFARVCGMSGDESVLLIEMNARRPALYVRMGLEGEGPAGLSQILHEGHALSSVVHRDPRLGFDVVHVGDNDPTLLQPHLDKRVPELLAEAKARYDTVVLDVPPVVMAPETPRIAAQVDGVVMVVYCGKTRREIVQRSIHMVEEFEGRVLGVVLNRKKYYIPDFLYERV